MFRANQERKHCSHQLQGVCPGFLSLLAAGTITKMCPKEDGGAPQVCCHWENITIPVFPLGPFMLPSITASIYQSLEYIVRRNGKSFYCHNLKTCSSMCHRNNLSSCKRTVQSCWQRPHDKWLKIGTGLGYFFLLFRCLVQI